VADRIADDVFDGTLEHDDVAADDALLEVMGAERTLSADSFVLEIGE
jgi:hypothetical protein